MEEAASPAESKGDTSMEAAKEDNSVKPVSQIKKVNVGNGSGTSEIAEDCDPALKKRLEDRISGVFGISSDNIVISQINKLQK